MNTSSCLTLLHGDGPWGREEEIDSVHPVRVFSLASEMHSRLGKCDQHQMRKQKWYLWLAGCFVVKQKLEQMGFCRSLCLASS